MKILVYGGAASGKSEYAEARVMEFPAPRYYIATMEPHDTEAGARIHRHRLLREGKGLTTFECSRNLLAAPIPAGGACLLECLTNLAANERFSPEGAGPDTVEAVYEGVLRLGSLSRHLVVVTGDVFGDGENYSPQTTAYMDALAELNRLLAKEFDQVVEVAAGIPILLKPAVGPQY